MAEAVGYAVLPVTVSLSGITGQLNKQLSQPAAAAAKRASQSINKQLSDGANAAAAAVEKARNREETATRRVVQSEDALKKARDTAEQKAKSVESAELKLQSARATEKSKVAAAEEKLTQLRESGTASAEKIEAAEANLEAVRSSQGAKVIDAENRLSRERANSETAAVKAAEAEDKVTTAKKRAADASEEVIDATRRMDDAQASANSRAAESEGVFSRLREKMSSLKEGMFGARSEAGQMGSSIGSMNSSFGQAQPAAGGLAGSLLDMSKKAGIAAVALAGITSAGAVMKAGLEKMMSIEDTTASLGILMGSADEAKKVMDDLRESNQATPYSFDAWASAGKNLIAFGVEAEQVSSTVTALGEAASASGKGESALNSMADAFGKAAASGKISLNTINTLSEGGVNGLQILANEAGVSTEEMQKLISKGAVPAQEAIKTLTDGILEGSDGVAGATKSMSGVMGEMAQTTRGRLTNLKSAFVNVAGSIAGLFMPVIAGLAKALTDAIYVVKGFIDAIIGWEGWTVAWNAIKDAITSVWDAITTAAQPVIELFGRIKGAFTELKNAFTLDSAVEGNILGKLVGEERADNILGAIQTVKGAVEDIWGLVTGAASAPGSALEYLIGADKARWIADTIETVKIAWKEIVEAFTGGDWGYGALASLVGADRAEWIVNAVASVGDAFHTVVDVIKQIPDLAGGVWDILFRGDFTGLPFGLEEDSGIVDFLFNLRDAAKAVGGFLKDNLFAVLQDLWDAVKSLGPAVLDMGKALGGAVLDAAKGLWEGLTGLWDGVRKLWDALSPLLIPALKVVGAVLGGVVLGAIFGVVGAFRLAAGVIKAAAGVISWLASNVLAPLISVVGKVAEVVGTVLGGAFSILGDIIGWIADLVGDRLTALWGGITTAWEASISFLGDLFTGLWEGMQAAWGSVGQPIVDFIVNAFQLWWEGIQLYFRLVRATFEVIWEAMKRAWDAVGQPLVDLIVSAFQTWWNGVKIIFGWVKTGWELLWSGLQAAWSAVGQPVVDFVKTAFDTFWRGLKRIFGWVQDGWDILWGAVTSAWNAVGQPIVDRVVQVFNTFRDNIGRAFDTVKGFAQGLWNSISNWFGKIFDKVSSIKDKVLDAVKGAGSWLVDTGKNIIDGLLNGIGDLGKKITDWFLNKIPGWMKEPFKKALGIHSPSRVFKDFGQNIGEGLIGGLESMGSQIEKAAQGMADRVASAEMPTLAPDVDYSAVQEGSGSTAANAAAELESAYREDDWSSSELSKMLGGNAGLGNAAVAAAGAAGQASRGDMSGAMDSVSIALDEAAGAMQQTTSGVLDLMWAQQNTAVTGFGQTMLDTTGKVVTPAFAGMAAGLGSVKSSVVDPVFNGMIGGLTSVGSTFTAQTGGVIGPQWTNMAGTLQTVKTGVVDPTFAGVQQGLVATGTQFTNSVQSVINPQWSGMGSHLDAVQRQSILPTFTTVQGGLDTLGGWFSTTVTNIGTAWDRMRAATGKPARFVVETVYGGIKNAWDSIAELIGEKKMKGVGLGNLGAYKHGGVTPGYSPGRDIHRFVSPTGGTIDLSGGEGILIPQATRALGGKPGIDSVNRLAKSGRLHDMLSPQGAKEAKANGYQAFAGGGIVQAMTNIVQRKYPMLQMTSGFRPGDGGNHGAGRAADFSNGSGNTPQQLALAKDIAKTYPNSMELIYDSPGWAGNIKDGANVGAFGQFYTMAQAGPHHHHVHWAMNTPPTLPFGGGVFPGGSSGAGAAMVSMVDTVKGMWDAEIKKIPKFKGGVGQFGQVPAKFQEKAAAKVWKHAEKLADKMDADAGPGSWNPGAGVEQYRPGVVKAFKFQDEDPKKNRVDALLRQIWTESKGDPNIAQQIVDVNGTGESAGVGLYQVIPSTWQGYRDPRLPDNRRNVWAAHSFAVRYFRDRHNWNTGPGGVGLPGTGWKTGGVLPDDLPAALFDTGGYLNSGEAAVNLSGNREPVFTAAQWQVLRQSVTANAAIAGPVRDWVTHGIDELEAIANGIDRYHKGWAEWAAESADHGRLGNAEELAITFGGAAAKEFASDALSLIGLDGLADITLSDSFVDLVNAGADTANQVWGTRFGHIDKDVLQPQVLVDDTWRVAKTESAQDVTAAAEAVETDRAEPTVEESPSLIEDVDNTPEPGSAISAQADTTTVNVTLEGDAYSADEVEELIKKLNESVDGVDVRVERLEKAQMATVVAGIR
ncbi:MAG: tape measure protein [Corynebacterium sp.]|uniref:tape measure protein n=1 Tax=Corynebacterium sp. TaxID=1720 RepID=UPI003F124EF3